MGVAITASVFSRVRSYFSVIRAAWGCFRAGRCDRLAAVMALHMTIGLVALGIVLAWVAGMTRVEMQPLSDYVHLLIGKNAAGVFDNLLEHAHLDWHTWVPVAAVFCVFVWNVVAVMRIVQAAVNTAVGVESTVAREQWGRVALKRLLGTAFVALVTFGLVVSFSAKTALEVLDAFGVDPVAATPWIFRIAEVVAALILATVLFGGVFQLLPDAKLELRLTVHGAFWAAKLYTVGQIAAAFAIVYVGRMSFYGEAAILLVIIGYLYVSAVSFLWGTQVLRVEIGRHKVQPRPSPWAGRVAETVGAAA